MKNILFILLATLTVSCSVLIKDKAEIEKVAEDIAIELVEDAALL